MCLLELLQLVLKHLMIPWSTHLSLPLTTICSLSAYFLIFFVSLLSLTMTKRKATKSPDNSGKTSKEAKKSAPSISGIFSTITHAEINSIANWNPQPSPPTPSSSLSKPQLASQVSKPTERSSTTTRNMSSSLEPILKLTPLFFPLPPPFKHEETLPEGISLNPTSLPQCVEHAHTNPPVLSQTLDKNTTPPTHVHIHVHHAPSSLSPSDLPSSLNAKALRQFFVNQKTMVDVRNMVFFELFLCCFS